MSKLNGALVATMFLLLFSFLAILPGPRPPIRPLPEFIPTAQASSFHDPGYENAWIQFIDKEERLVQIQAVESRIVIVFRVKKKEDLARYNEGWVAPVTFRCKGGGLDCDIGSQEKTYVGNLEVEPRIWKTTGSNKALKITKY
jgi:hypothetical protein